LINEIENYSGELKYLRNVDQTLLRNEKTIEKWITWLDSEIRHQGLSDWEKKNKQELKGVLEELIAVHHDPKISYSVMKQNIE
jgi:hypothetical protein